MSTTLRVRGTNVSGSTRRAANFLIQEICSVVQPGHKEKIWAEWFGFPTMRMVNGRFPLPTKPGLGFELSEASLSKYPFGGSKPMAHVFH